jgi:ABC-type phosphate transport system substrate-binding protein
MVVAGVASAEPTVAVVVHPTRADDPSLAEIRRIYLRQRRFWADGSPIVPIGQEASSAVRHAFDRLTLGRDPASLLRYWNQQYFDGTFPPATLASDEAVLRYVAARPNAIGYLDARVVDDTVRVVRHLVE